MAKRRSNPLRERYEEKPSLKLEGFLRFIRETKSKYNECEDIEKEANEETQDILHAIEFGDIPKRPSSIMSITKETRRKRRIAKTYREVTDPLVNWIICNPGIIDELSRILGAMRKSEAKADSRVYTPRTKVLDDNSSMA